MYTTNATSINFDFTQFPAGDADKGTLTWRVSYVWGLGSQPGLDDVAGFSVRCAL